MVHPYGRCNGIDQFKPGGKHKMINSCAPYTLLVDPEDSSKVWASNFGGISSIIYENSIWKIMDTYQILIDVSS